MKQDISTLMDGELCGEEAELLLNKIKANPESRQEWAAYHLIGDALRQPDCVKGNLKPDFFERLHAEPTVLAPQRKRFAQARYFAMSATASVMAIAFLAWLSVQMDSGQDTRPMANNLRTASIPLNADMRSNDNLNDYLLAHHEFSPASDMRGPASYIRTVAFEQSGAGK